MESQSGATSLSLLERVRGRDAAAWQRLVELYEPLVERWCRAAGLQPADAADVGQDVFLAVSRGIGGFERRAAGSFRRWLKVIADRKIVDFWRRRGVAVGAGGSEARDVLETAPAPPDDDAVLTEERRLLHRRALELLARDFEPATWRAFWRVVVDGVRPADAAAELSATVGAVYKAKSRVLARLRAEFADLLDE